ncbi:glycerol-3-phosphate 1-O-acyltransferase PlsY [Fretibacterium sp. OH1220_COT-178]|uniref:glycerol-3-phosphate 1-O-acyltransferase PlsY n=1 Tax=Fretibacterium sp. OH1220_COT-178 TaxID=2491047 RepID=UPI000F5F4CC5|nr:glycerol-3-phosphate 1-O-acyltransferase PlsY [Fretibacterium sp. OH1220_COT-178]RRD65595.1 glycerol-3-phosphate 1-O-acyltransferase [Fretibacterium sp. OH1220_COT-178]
MRVAMLWMIVSYFIGSLPTGYLAARIFRGVDIRTVGSGAIGATNVRRLMGQRWAVCVTVIDMLKGALALLLTANSASSAPWMLSLSAFCVVLGHNYPVWLKFKGGKGVATTYGTMFFLWPYNSFAIVLMCGAVWYAVMTTSRYVSLASMTSLLAMPLFFWMLDAPLSFILLALFLALLAVFRHRSNIGRLLRGRENSL